MTHSTLIGHIAQSSTQTQQTVFYKGHALSVAPKNMCQVGAPLGRAAAAAPVGTAGAAAPHASGLPVDHAHALPCSAAATASAAPAAASTAAASAAAAAAAPCRSPAGRAAGLCRHNSRAVNGTAERFSNFGRVSCVSGTATAVYRACNCPPSLAVPTGGTAHQPPVAGALAAHDVEARNACRQARTHACRMARGASASTPAHTQ